MSTTDKFNAPSIPQGKNSTFRQTIRIFLQSKHWIPLLDLALIVTLLLLYFDDSKIFYFHFIFIFLTFGAFYWSFQAFIIRSTVAVVVTSALLVSFVFAYEIPAGELIEIPMLSSILILVFAITRQRAKAEDALRSINEDLENRVSTRTADLVREINERQQTEQTLRASEERYRHLVELSFEAVAIHTERELIYVNPAGMRLLSIASLNELKGKSLFDFVHPDSYAAVLERLHKVTEATKGAPLAEETFIRADGTQVDVETVTIPITYEGQAAMQTVIRDITIRKQAEQARMAERMSIARDLHDSLGQSLGYLHLKLDELASLTAESAEEPLQQELLRMRAVASDAYEQVRSMLAALMPANTVLLTKALRDRAKLISRQAAFKVQVVRRGRETTLPPVLQQQVLSLCSEALANVAKHAGAKQVKIELWWTATNLTITLEDDGCGFDVNRPQAENSFGLRIMQERAAQIGGSLLIQSQFNVGTQLTLQLPLSGA
ncbi:MAG: PAS domain S-box protein [Caldilineaceae bacterium]